MTDLARVFIIAEAGSNWRAGTPARDRAMTQRLIDAAAAAGADALKFQTYRAASVYVPDAGTIALEGAADESINDVFRDLEMPYDFIPEIAERCDEAGIEFMSTPFSLADAAAVDPHVRRHKVASYELNHVRLVEHLAGLGKPLIMSTGAALESDIEFGLATARAAGARDITLLQCTASYPAPIEALNLRAIPWLRERFGVAGGLSDHSRDPLVAPVAAVALGATVIEKHITIDRRLPGPDHPFAIEPDELVAMVTAIRAAEAALGEGEKVVQPAEAELRTFAIRAIQAIRDIAVGEPLVDGDNIDVLRPGRRRPGLHPRYLEAIAGRRARRPVGRGDGVTAADVDPPLDE